MARSNSNNGQVMLQLRLQRVKPANVTNRLHVDFHTATAEQAEALRALRTACDRDNIRLANGKPPVGAGDVMKYLLERVHASMVGGGKTATADV